MEIGTFTPDNLLAGDFPRVTAWLTIPSGSSLKRGTVITAAGVAMPTYEEPDSGDPEPDEPYGVLAEDANASAAAVQAPVFLTGEFSVNHLILAGGDPVSDADRANLRKLSIFAKDTVPAA